MRTIIKKSVEVAYEMHEAGSSGFFIPMLSVFFSYVISPFPAGENPFKIIDNEDKIEKCLLDRGATYGRSKGSVDSQRNET